MGKNDTMLLFVFARFKSKGSESTSFWLSEFENGSFLLDRYFTAGRVCPPFTRPFRWLQQWCMSEVKEKVFCFLRTRSRVIRMAE